MAAKQFKNIEECRNYIIGFVPNGVLVSKIEKILSAKAFDVIVPKSLCKIKTNSKQMTYTISEEMGDLYMFCEETNTNWDEIDYSEIDNVLRTCVGMNESNAETLVEALSQILNDNRI